MESKDTFTRVVAVVGTVLVLLPAIAPLLFSGVRMVDRGVFRLDYLMPAEMFPLALGGGLLLFWVTTRARAYRGLVGWGLLVAVVALVASQALVVVSGLASGDTAPEGLWWALVLGLLLVYWLVLAVVAVGGVLLLRRLFGGLRS